MRSWLDAAGMKAWTREFIGLAGPRTLKWGALVVASALGVFALDLVFAVMLQRFLGAVGLLNTGAATPLLGQIGAPGFEAIVFLIVAVFRVGAMWVNGFATGVCGVTFEANQRRDIGRWALNYDRASIGEFTTLFNDVLIGSAAVAGNIFHLASRIVLTIATLVVLGIYSIEVTLAVIAVVVLAVPLHRIIDARLNYVSGVMQQSLAKAVDRLVAGVKNSLFLRIHGLTAQEERESRALIGSYERTFRAYYGLAAARNAIPLVLAMVVLVAIAFVGSTVFVDDKGYIVAYLYLTLRLFQGLSEMARVSANTRVNLTRYDVLCAWRRRHGDVLRETLEQSAVTPSTKARSTGPIGWRLEGVDFRYDPAEAIVERLSLTIAPGTAVVIVGASGSGKTTLLLLLSGVLQPDQGRIDVLFPDGTQSIVAARERLLADIAYVGPDPFVVPGTLREFLTYGLAEAVDDHAIHQALKRAHCEFALERGLEHLLTEQGEGLSAGQKQRLSLARALLRRPKALLLDEPTANLDANAERVLIGMLGELKGECTMVAVTHGTALRDIADQLVTLAGSDGTVTVEQGASVRCA